jgi:ATP-dependent RNA helicase RhlE
MRLRTNHCTVPRHLSMDSYQMPFAALGLLPELTRALADRGYTEPTPVQSRVIPEILAGRDILAGSQTGTGKTAGFTLPILQQLHEQNHPAKGPRALILVPTRELAAQVADSVKSYGKYLRLRTLVVFGGVSINPQIDALRRGTDVLVATPGRLLDHAQQRTVDLSHVRTFVLDEADRMLDMGFIADIRRVIKLLPGKRQNLMFSATYSEDIRGLAQSLLRHPAEIEVARRNAAVESVEQRVYKVAKDQKRALLSHLISDGNWNQVLIFTRTKHGANRLTKQLQQDGIEAAAIHGNKSQSARTQALAAFKQSRIRALVATEVASRGLDIKELPHVVNYELPNVPEDYVHRIGRTGRAGASGHAISLVSSDESGLLKDIERLLRKSIPDARVPVFKAAPPPVHDQEERRSRPPQRAQSSGRHRGGGAGQTQNNSSRRPRAQGQPKPARPSGQAAHSGRPQPTHRSGSRPAQPQRGRPR